MNKPMDEDQDLRAALGRLPQSIEPERDLWTGIQAGIQADIQASNALPASRKAATVSWPWALAASVASLAVGVVVTLSMHRAAVPTPVVAALPPVVAPENSFVPASTHAMATKLRATCLAQLANLPPQTREKVEKDLELIRVSVIDIQSALAKDPGNALLQDLLVTTYQNELHTLANVQAAASAAHTEVSL